MSEDLNKEHKSYELLLWCFWSLTDVVIMNVHCAAKI